MTDDSGRVHLREVRPEDVDIFFEHQRDEESNRMAAFPPRERAAHTAHWRDRILAVETAVARTVVYDGDVAGNVVSWHDGTHRYVGYWIDKRYWGRGIATRALSLLLEELTERPLHAHVASHNEGSIRVLEKCGFRRTATEEQDDGFVDVLMELEA